MCLTIVATSSMIKGAQVDYGAYTDFIYLNNTSTAVPQGNAVLLGTFPANYNFTLNNTSYTNTMANFTQYGRTVIGSGGAPDGEFADSAANLENVNGYVAGSQLYIWIFNNVTPAQATQWAIVTDITAQWFAPAAGPNTNSIETGDIGSYVPIGALGFKTIDGNFQLGVIPEPSTYILILVISVLGFVVHRKRKTVAG